MNCKVCNGGKRLEGKEICKSCNDFNNKKKNFCKKCKKQMPHYWKNLCNKCDKPNKRYKKSPIEKSLSKLEQLKREALKADYVLMDDWMLGSNLSKRADKQYILDNAEIVILDDVTFDIIGFKIPKNLL